MPSTFETPRSSRRSAAEPAAEDEPNTTTPSPSPGRPSLIRAGWSAGQAEMDKASDYAQSLKLDDKFQVVKFTEDAPYAAYRRHWIERMTQQGVKKRPYTCLESVGAECPLCDIGDKPQAVTSFNVVLIGDDGVCALKSFDVGPRLFNQLKSFSNDPMIGALTKGYWMMSRTGKGGNTSYNIIPKTEADLRNQHNYVIPTDDAIQRVGKYDASIIQIPALSDLQEVAQEIQDY